MKFVTHLKTLIIAFSFLYPTLIIKAQNYDHHFIERITSADSIKNLFNGTTLKEIEKWSVLNLDHKFFIVDSTEFYRNQVKTLNTNFRKYMEHVMSLKFINSNPEIQYKPTLIKDQILYDTQGYLKTLSTQSFYDKKLNTGFNMKKINERFFFEEPHLVKFVWKTIPEPHRLITDRKHLDKRSAREAIMSMLEETISRPEKLEKKIKPKGPWTIGGIESIQLSQAYLENWSKGGENSIALQSDLKFSANYKKNKNEWENFVRHKIGIISSESYQTQINNDQIEANSKYGLKASKKWYYSSLFNFKSQFFNGYNNKERESITSSFMSPAYFTLAIGMDYKKNKNFTLLLSPFTSKITFVLDTAKVNQTDYKISKDKKASFNSGASIVNIINWEISTELNLKSNLDAFIGYFNEESITQVDWELIFDMRINRYLSTTINTQLRYFTNESEKIQLKEYFAINFNYKF